MSLQTRNLPEEYIKPISRGQVTIPKNYRDAYGIDQNTWLRVVGDQNRILLYPQDKTALGKKKLADYKQQIKKIDGSWWTGADEMLRLKGRQQIEDRLKDLWRE